MLGYNTYLHSHYLILTVLIRKWFFGNGNKREWEWVFGHSTGMGIKVKGKGRYSSFWGGTLPQSYGTSLAIWDLTVLLFTRHKWTRPAYYPSHARTYSIYLPRRDGKLSWYISEMGMTMWEWEGLGIRSANQNCLIVPRCRLSTYGCRALHYAGPTV